MAKKNTFTICLNAGKNALIVKWANGGPGDPTILDYGDSIEVKVGDGWDKGDKPYIWRLGPFAPKAGNTGPNYGQSQGVWQCDCKSPPDDKPLEYYSVDLEPSRDAKPESVNLTNNEVDPEGGEDHHWLCGRVAWGDKPDDPCEHPDGRLNLPFDPELENRSGTHPNCQIQIVRRGRSRPQTGVSPSPASDEVTRLLDAWSAGDPEALERAMPLVIDELRLLARSYMARQRPGHTLQPTALVNEAYARLVGGRPASWESRRQFFAYVASTMRRILVNHARDRRAAKRGDDVTRVAFDEALDVPAGAKGAAVEVDLLDLDRALESLAAVDPRQGRIVELRYFGGLTVAETAGILEVSERTVKREWHTARLWLLKALG